MISTNLITISEEELITKNIYYNICRLPNSIRAFTTIKNQETLILINDSLSLEERKRAFLHELIHIQSDHFEHYSFTNKYRHYCEDQVHKLLN